jgi:O-antigen/teichoic acid export membrane protein
MPTNTARIAKNTLMLYFRQILIMLVSLYTVRVVLETLGAEDYGIYNVVAGVVAMFGFLSTSMSSTSQRFFSIEIGRGNLERLNKLFSISLIIYILIAFVIFLLAETVGLWFLYKKVKIPDEKIFAVSIVFQCAVISLLCTIVIALFKADIIAHEDMNLYASVSIIECLAKIVMVVLLKFIIFDKLILYSVLMLIIVFFIMIIYIAICRKKYEECSFKIYKDRYLFKKIGNYASWNFFGPIADMVRNQGITLLLNQFFNSLVVSSRAIALQVNMATVSFAGNFYNAMRPQIIKNYAAGDDRAMMAIVHTGAKGTYFLVYIFTLPFFLEMPLVLTIWLKNLPDYIVIFTRLALLETLLNAVTMPIGSIAHATGKIKLYQAVVYGTLILNLPISWVCLYSGASPSIVVIVSLALSACTVIEVLLIVRHLIGFSIRKFMINVVFPLAYMTVVSTIAPVLVVLFVSESVVRLFLIIFISVAMSCGSFYYIALNKMERKKIYSMVLKRIKKNI